MEDVLESELNFGGRYVGKMLIRWGWEVGVREWKWLIF